MLFTSSTAATRYTNHCRYLSLYDSSLNRKFTPPSNAVFRIRCSDSQPRRGFGRPPSKKDNKKATKTTTSSNEKKGSMLQQRNSGAQQSANIPRQAPGISSRTGGKSTDITFDPDFEERLEAVKRSAIEQKKSDENKECGAIDYDAPVESEGSTIGLGTKIGVGVAVIVFALVFALGDFLPSGSVSPTEEASVVNTKLSGEEKAKLQARLQQYKATLKISPDDQTAFEGAAVTLTELGEYTQAASLLEDLTKKKPDDPDAFRLLGEVKYQLKDYEGSVAAYRSSAMVSKTTDFDVLRGITNALLAAKKPDEAVQVLLSSRKRLNEIKSDGLNIKSDSSTMQTAQKVDPIQVELLLGKAYSDWGHFSDAVAVYDQLISKYPDDFRGYLAKGIILKENGKVGDAERMFIQARFFAPEKAKALVDRYSRQ